MKSDAAPYQAKSHEICVYECEIHLKFRLVEEKCALFGDRDELLEFLIEAFTTGSDEYMEPLETQIKVEEVPDLDASVQMRRLLMRLRNSSELTKSPSSLPKEK
ncbi:MAG: Npun_R1517 family heterocyst differentiation transcriptional regulator [Chroococcidiopsidaceae cyanobacterium CP_BM_RX_35]|nr:Npun_R1517 family heterocyst differentiation transcriptional regulator [Chroococcidiopsidaceae cyanobacterium CP_BM_RX_35]